MKIIIKDNASSFVDDNSTTEYIDFIEEVQGKTLPVKTRELYRDSFDVLYKSKTYHINENLVSEVLDDIRSEYYKCTMCGNCTPKYLYTNLDDRCEIESCRVAGFLESLV